MIARFFWRWRVTYLLMHYHGIPDHLAACIAIDAYAEYGSFWPYEAVNFLVDGPP